MAEEELVVEEQQEEVLSPEELEKKQKKAALTAFILALVGMLFWGWPIVGIILCAIALKKTKAAAGIQVKPHKIFNAIAKPVAIVFLILSILSTVFWGIGIIVGIVVGIIAIIGAAGGAASLLLL